MQTPKVFKSLAELPGDAWKMAASLPSRAMRASRRVARQPARLAQRAMGGLNREWASLRLAQPWRRGGLNE